MHPHYPGLGTQSAESSFVGLSDLRQCYMQGLMTLHYNSISRYMNDPTLTSLLQTLLQETALPLKSVV